MIPTFKELADGLIELKKQAYPSETVRINASHINRVLEALERAERFADIVKRLSREPKTEDMSEDFKRRNLEMMWDEFVGIARHARATLKGGDAA